MANVDLIPASPNREAKQSRSKLLMQSVREATLALIEEVGVDSVTTVKVAERAGISPGSLYRYYPNKQAIFTDVYNHSLMDLDAQLEQQMRAGFDGDLEDVMRATVSITFRFYRELTSLNKSFFSTYLHAFDFTQRQVSDSGETWESIGRQWLIATLEKNAGRLRVDDFEETADFLFQLTTGFCHRLVSFEPDNLNDERAEVQLYDLLLRYLLKDDTK